MEAESKEHVVTKEAKRFSFYNHIATYGELVVVLRTLESGMFI